MAVSKTALSGSSPDAPAMYEYTSIFEVKHKLSRDFIKIIMAFFNFRYSMCA